MEKYISISFYLQKIVFESDFTTYNGVGKRRDTTVMKITKIMFVSWVEVRHFRYNSIV